MDGSARFEKERKGIMAIYEKLLAIQCSLKAPKNQYNSFGKYHYRNCEDILEAVKPLLREHGLLLTLSDEIVLIGTRYYVKVTAKVTDGENEICVCAMAREEESKKGMDGSQITGSSSSYARKYALNGLFNIDDTKDQDALNKGQDSAKIYQCSDCGKAFEGFVAKSTGKEYTAGQAYHMSKNKHGRALCKECAAKVKEAEHE